ncbi:MAG: hypothetical protein PUE25_03710 [bacterium]|nr:hypothetical protein [bacterium]
MAIDAIDAIVAIEDGLLGMWAWWDGGDKKVGFAEEKAASRKKTAPVGVAWVAAWVWALRGGRKILRPYI